MKNAIYIIVCLFLLTGFTTDHNNLTVTNRSLLLMQPEEFFSHSASQETINLIKPNDHLLSVSVYQATNLLRKKHGLSPLKPDYALHLAGQDHISSMKKNRFFDHYDPYNSKQKTFWQRIKNHGGKFRTVAENIALVHPFRTDKSYYQYRKVGNQYYYYDEKGRELSLMTYGELGKSILTDWYNSKGHRKNLLAKDLTHLGIATHISEKNKRGKNLPKVYAVQNFGAY